MTALASKKPLPSDVKLDLNNISLIGKNIILRPIEAKDYPALKEVLSDPTTMDQLKFMAHLDSGGWSDSQIEERYLDNRLQQEKGTSLGFAICAAITGVVLGDCGFKKLSIQHKNAEFGMVLHHKFWGSGAAEECFLLCLDFGFSELGLHRIEFLTLTTHLRVTSFLKKIDIKLEAIKKESVFDEGVFKDAMLYVLFDSDWKIVQENLQERLAKKYSK